MCINIFINIFQLNKGIILACTLGELFNPCRTVFKNGKNYIFYCPNKLVRWRINTYFTKEPETIEWIDTFKEGDTLFDIGANIGLYSIYAAKRGMQVVAFEPESQNYALLNKNAFLNQCDSNLSCLNIALADCDSVDYLYLPYFEAGRAANCFGASYGWDNNIFTPKFKQGVISLTLDSFLKLYRGNFPAHIKIDVDGIEPKIIKGAEKSLEDKRLRSLSVELNESLPEHVEVARIIQSKGFTLLHKKHASMFDSSIYDKSFNYCFIRKDL
jgi:FkbM family methyltransferase